MKQNTKKTIYTAGLTAAVALSALGLSGCTGASPVPGTMNVEIPDTLKVANVDGSYDMITVTGREEVKVVPDMAQIIYSVYTREDTAAACQEKNAKDLDAAIETLKGLGVEETSIQTSSYGLSPIRNWNSGNQEITGYEMNTTITVSDIPIDNAGAIMSQSVAAGVNSIDSVSYFSSNYDASYQEALKAAMAVAQAKAEAIAEASGMSLDSVVHVEEVGYNPNTRYSSYRSSAPGNVAVETAAAAADMAVMPGQVSVEASVIVDYKLAK